MLDMVGSYGLSVNHIPQFIEFTVALCGTGWNADGSRPLRARRAFR